MTRLLVAGVLLALPAVASTQGNTSFPSGYPVVVGPPMLDGYVVNGPPITDGVSALYPVQTVAPPRFSVGGGSMSGYPAVWVPSGSWGYAYYQWPVYPVYVPTNPAPPPPRRGQSLSVYPQLSAPTQTQTQTKATLVVQLPAAGEIWVDGKKVDGEQATEWTLTSPELKAGESHTFEVKGRWKSGKKTFETSQSVSVAAADRYRVIVVSGTEIK